MRNFKSEFFKALAHPLRIGVLDELRRGPLTVSELQRRLGVEQSTLSQQLAILRASNLVRSSRSGTSVTYAVSDPAIWRVLDRARDVFERQLVSLHSAMKAQRRSVRLSRVS